jgi:glycosyltransferase involved in cell wall biosynthesis
MYHPELILNKINTNEEIIKWVNETTIWTNKKDFLNNTKLDYKFYSNYYNMKDQTEDDVIYNYINYGAYAKYIKNIDEYEHKEPEIFNDFFTLISKETKILIVCHELTLTGGSLVATDLYDFCKDKGYEIDLLNLQPIHNFINTHKNLHVYDLENYDIIIVNTIANNVIKWCNTNIKYMEKFILWLHETHEMYYTEEFKKIYFKLVLCDSNNVLNTFMKNYNYSNTLTKVLYLPNEDYILRKDNINKLSIRKEFDIKENTIVYINIGTISDYKAQIDILKALNYAFSTNQLRFDMKFIFAGYKNNILEQYINKSPYKLLFDDYVKIVKPLSYKECYKFFAIGDVYINCTKNEPYGKVLIESMEWKLPIIAYNGGSHKELIVDNFNGLLYNNEQELWQKIIFFYENKQLIETFGINGNVLYLRKIPNKITFFKDFFSLLSLITNKHHIPKIDYENVKKISIPELNLLELSHTIYNNELFIFGGYKSNSSIENKNVYSFNFETNNIKKINTLPNDCATTHYTNCMYNNYYFIISGQIGDHFGYAINSCYIYNLKMNDFIKMPNLPFELFAPVCFIQNKILFVLSGTNNTRVLPNMNYWFCKIFDENDELILNPIWTQKTDFIVGTAHPIIINNNNEIYYFSGCECHVCSTKYYKSLYIHNNNNLKIKLIDDCNLEKTSISKINIPVSHCSASSFIKNDIIYIIGGQLNYDYIYNGYQLYYTKLDICVNLLLDKNYIQYFNKGCMSFIYNKKLYLSCGQYGDNNNYNIEKFNDNLFIFDLIK